MSAIKQQKLLRNSPSLVPQNKARAYKWFLSTLSLASPFNRSADPMTKKNMSNNLILIVKDKKTNHLLKLVKRLQHVKSVTLDITLNFKFADGDLIKLLKCLNSHLKCLKEFQLLASNAHSKLTNTGISKLGKSLIRLPKVTLGLARIDNLTDSGIISLSKRLSKMPQISDFHIDLAECQNIGTSSITALSDSLKGKPSLQKLTISSTDCPQISKEGVLYLFKTIAQLTKLTYLQINSTAYIDDTIWSEILTTFDNFQNLTYFGSNFEIRPITNKRIDEFSTKICALTNLKTLSLKFLLCFELSDDGIAYLCRNLARMKNLENLTLEIWRTEESTDHGVESLAQYICQLKGLQTLNLGFFNYSKLTNESFGSLQRIPKELEKLTELNFVFKNCERIRVPDFNNFQKEVYKYENIKYKNVRLEGAHIIHDIDISLYI